MREGKEYVSYHCFFMDCISRKTDEKGGCWNGIDYSGDGFAGSRLGQKELEFKNCLEIYLLFV